MLSAEEIRGAGLLSPEAIEDLSRRTLAADRPTTSLQQARDMLVTR